MRIAVIGAGWYGCHIGMTLRALGMEVDIYERNSMPLAEASGNNQFRLHMGFHYARSYTTRLQSRDGYSRFLERYPFLSREVHRNIYAVPSTDSLLDFLTYKLVMTSAGIEFKEESPEDLALSNIAGAISCDERVILTQDARRHFIKKLGADLLLDTRVVSLEDSTTQVRVNGTSYDWLIDCTWGHISAIPYDAFFEPTILLYYSTKLTGHAYTMVDGPLCSVYPTEDPSVVTLSSVLHTPLATYTSPTPAEGHIRRVTGSEVEEKRHLMEKQICRYLPWFRDMYAFEGPQLSVKTKLTGLQDDRSCYVSRQGRVISVMSGKVDTVFFAAQRVLGLLEEAIDEPGPLRTQKDVHEVLA